MVLWVYDLKKTIEVWGDKVYHFVDRITSSPVFPAIATLILFVVACWGISYFSRKN